MKLQRVRIVCVSDTHEQTPKLPAGDVLIHAGDLTRHGSPAELRKIFGWLDSTKFKVKIVVAGNHDRGLDPQLQHRGKLDQSQEKVQANIDLFSSSPNLHYLHHESKIITVPYDDGTKVIFKVFGSPCSPNPRIWGFGYRPSEGVKLWQTIPLDADIVVTHTPARDHLDQSHRGAVGCEGLRGALWRVRPRLFVCGHIHEARGVEVVEWDLETPDTKFGERSARAIEDPSPADSKQFCIDLSSRATNPLQNNGSRGHVLPFSLQSSFKGVEVKNKVKGAGLDFKIGRGGPDSDTQIDQEAIAGRRGREQTCIVNASFLASSGTYRGSNGRHFNKVIVIDLDLPVDDDRDV